MSSSPITTTTILTPASGKLVCNISMKYYQCLCAVLPSIYSSSNTVVVSLQVIVAIGMLTAHITDDTNLCFVFLVFLLLAGTIIVGIIIVLCMIMLWYIRKRKMTSRHQNKVLTVS